MSRSCVYAFLLTLFWPLAAAAQATWNVDTPSRAGDVRLEPFLGREALWLRNNTQAVYALDKLVDGAIEFDLAPMDDGDFAGLVFRRVSARDHENIYFRLRRDGDFMAVQYAPRINGSSTWQLYPEFAATAAWPRNQWTRVRAEVQSNTLRVFVGDMIKPVITVPRLRRAPIGAEVAVWARVNGAPEKWAAAISNFTMTPVNPRTEKASAPDLAPGIVTQWEISEAVHEATGEQPSLPPPAVMWRTAQVEEGGLVNLNRVYVAQQGKRITAYARTTVTAPAATRRRLGIGYSDDVTVFLNGEMIYAGRNGWQSRYPGFASFVDPRFESVRLTLKPGENEIVLAITDDQLFGWGFAACME